MQTIKYLPPSPQTSALFVPDLPPPPPHLYFASDAYELNIEGIFLMCGSLLKNVNSINNL